MLKTLWNALSSQAGVANAFVVAAVDALATKGTFSVAIPSGSVVTALAACKDRLEFDNVHVFFTNDKVCLLIYDFMSVSEHSLNQTASLLSKPSLR